MTPPPCWPFGTFPKIHPFWYRYSSFVTRPRTTVFISDWITRKKQEQTVLQRSGRLNLEPPWCQKSDLTSLLAISDHLWKKFPRGWGQGVKKSGLTNFLAISDHFSKNFFLTFFGHENTTCFILSQRQWGNQICTTPCPFLDCAHDRDDIGAGLARLQA